MAHYGTCCSRLFVSPLTAQTPAMLLDEPFVENGGTVVLPAPANASNVSIIIICNVSFQGTPLATHWYLTFNGERRTSVLDMNDPNFQLSGGLLVPILTIVLFGKDLDMAVLECSNAWLH